MKTTTNWHGLPMGENSRRIFRETREDHQEYCQVQGCDLHQKTVTHVCERCNGDASMDRLILTGSGNCRPSLLCPR
nr:hypothetical protein [Mariniblastus sp.]